MRVVTSDASTLRASMIDSTELDHPGSEPEEGRRSLSIGTVRPPRIAARLAVIRLDRPIGSTIEEGRSHAEEFR